MHVHLLDLNAGQPNRGTAAIVGLCEGNGRTVLRYDVRAGGELPADATGVWILGGGPGSPHESGAWRRALLSALERRILSGQPTLGICYGFELLALAAGAEVRELNQVREGIYAMVASPVWARYQAVSAYEKRSFGVFGPFSAAHSILAHGPEGDVAAVQLGDSALGVIFHPEADLGPETATIFSTIIPEFLARHP